VAEATFRVTFILTATEALTSAISKWRLAPSDCTANIGRCAQLYPFLSESASAAAGRPEIILRFF
jgi:hypothetical protein